MITVCDRAEKSCPIFPGMGMRLHWPIGDPAEFVGTEKEMLARFRVARDQLDLKVRGWLGEQGIIPSRQV
jgi:arsenate reductase